MSADNQRRGSALATAGVSSLLTNLLPITAGIVVFSERRPGGEAGVLRALGLAGVGIGAALLASLGYQEAELGGSHRPPGVALGGDGRGTRGAAQPLPERTSRLAGRRGRPGGDGGAANRAGDLDAQLNGDARARRLRQRNAPAVQ